MQQERLQTIVCTTPLGQVGVQISARGICKIGFTDAATTPATSPYQKIFTDYLSGRTQALDLPLDIQGTPFQKTVWAALQNIPCGTTITYAQLAAQIGQSTAVRAVARACAANPIALAIPCHRVIRTDGHLGGYRWGVALKQKLLQLEQTNK